MDTVSVALPQAEAASLPLGEGVALTLLQLLLDCVAQCVGDTEVVVLSEALATPEADSQRLGLGALLALPVALLDWDSLRVSDVLRVCDSEPVMVPVALWLADEEAQRLGDCEALGLPLERPAAEALEHRDSEA